MWGSQSDALGARCVFCNFPYFHVPTWEVMGVHASVPNISWTRRITPLGLGIPWPPCWRFVTIPNHGLTPKTGGVGRHPKDMLDANELIPILWHTLVQVGHVPHLPHP